ncbi:MAG: type III pantothenate kinase [Chloroflexi bacterium]|nr:type III pantothenate kinase [Chloroflexota bacterium]
MLLTIDIGNTNVTFGVFDGETLKATGRAATDRSRMPDEYAIILLNLLPLKGVSPKDIDAVSMCSVVPPLTPTFVRLCQDYFKIAPFIVGAGTKTGVRILYDNPRDVGADRIVDAVAALKIYGGPIISVDLGTATVFDAVTASGDYLGGAIAPGIGVSAEALYQVTSQLRRVELVKPPQAIGRNTIHAIQSGLVLGYADLVRGMVARFDKELGGGSKVIATGGLAFVVEKEVGIFDAIDVDLTLKGLRIVYEMNKAS